MTDNAFHFTRRSRRFSRRSDAVIDEYARLASVYDRRWSSYAAATAERSSQRLSDGPYRHVLDVGCGTGTFLSSLAIRFASARLVGIDLSRPMLDMARAKLPSTATLCRARAEALPFDDGRFDLVASLSALHDFDDSAQAAQEIHRVLQPAGTVLMTDWCGDFVTSKVRGYLARLRRGAGFAVLDSRRCRDLLERAGFCDVRVERYRIDRFWGLMTASGRKPGRVG